MDDNKKILQAILNGQSALKQELVSKINKVDQRVERLEGKIDQVEENLTKKIKTVEKNLTRRIDSIGRQLAYLEDDTPTREEFDKLENRVGELEQKSPVIST